MENNLIELRSYLKKEFKTKSELNSAYSQRAFARDLGLSPTTLNDFLLGKRDLCLKNIDKVFKYLGKKSSVFCSWCDKSIKDSELMIGGPKRQFICKSCVDVCNDIIQSGRKKA